MKILVLSDSHGNLPAMVQAVEESRPDRMIHLGDCWEDAQQLHRCFPGIPLEQVPGNCDFHSTTPPETLLTLAGKRVLLCHGHTYRVKESLMPAGYAAESRQLDAFLFGHTHRPFLEERRGCLFLNPGSIGSSPQPSYALLTLADGTLQAQLVPLK